MNFDPSNYSLNIQESIGTPTPEMGVPLGVCGLIPSHPPTLLGCILSLHLFLPLPWS